MDAMNHQSGDNQCRGNVAGYAQGQHRDQIGSGNRAVGRFRGRNAMNVAFTETIRILRYLFGRCIGHKRRG